DPAFAQQAEPGGADDLTVCRYLAARLRRHGEVVRIAAGQRNREMRGSLAQERLEKINTFQTPEPSQKDHVAPLLPERETLRRRILENVSRPRFHVALESTQQCIRR